MTKTLRRTVLVSAAICSATACSDSTNSSAVKSWIVTPNPIVLIRDDSVQLTANPLDGQGHLVTGVAVSFASSDTAIADVSILGMVHGRAKGSTTISVTGGGSAANVPTTVSATIASVQLFPPDTTIRQGASYRLRSAVVDVDGDTVPGDVLQYSSLSTGIVSVDATGLVRAIGDAGSGTIRADGGGRSALANVTVKDTSILARLPLSDRPTFGARTGNIAYITRADVPWVKKLDLTTTSFTDSVAAGSVPCGVVFNPAGTRAYVANQGSQNISVFDVATGSPIATFPVTGDPLPVAISLDGSTLFVTTNANRLYSLNSTTGAVLDSLSLPATSHHLFVHPNDSLLYVATRDAGSVLEVRWRTMTVTRTFTIGAQALGMEMAPDRSELYVTSGSTTSLYIVNLATGAVSSTPVGAGASTIALSADGSLIYVGQLFAGSLWVLNRTTRAHVKTITTGGTVRELILDAPRNRIIVANDAGWVDVVR
jgi:YVTN family beta-propeller protein